MAISKLDDEIVTENRELIKREEFIIDGEDDVANLPDQTKCMPGSLAIDASTGDKYIMDSTGTWHKAGGES